MRAPTSYGFRNRGVSSGCLGVMFAAINVLYSCAK